MTEEVTCDLSCGRKAVAKIGKLNLCEVCHDKFSENNPAPRLRFEDVVMPGDHSLEDEVL